MHTGTSDSEPPHTDTSFSSPETRLKLAGEAVTCHPWPSVPTGSHPLRWQGKESYSKDKTPFLCEEDRDRREPWKLPGTVPRQPLSEGTAVYSLLAQIYFGRLRAV